LTKKKLRELQRRISEHFYNEAQIMKDMLEADLSKDEIRELKEFMLKHPFYQISNFVQKKSEYTS
jgi:aminopeptidase C